MMMLNRPTYISEPAQFNANVRYWHKADMLNALTNVRFWGQSGQ
jgi:hypothetical protein